jgi:MFS transporter, SHS family, sialic acid transporter
MNLNTGKSNAEQRRNWMALFAALLGWMFDGFEMGLFPLVGPNALDELLRVQIAIDPTIKDKWFGIIMALFLIGAATGGVAFGWLGDRIGRVRAMSLSILVYAVFTGLCGFATQAWHIAALRFIASLAMGGEWALGVALVIELWPDNARAYLAGLIGAAANVGFLLVGLLSLVLVRFIQSLEVTLLDIGVPSDTVSTLLAGDGWRLLMIAGALPALLVLFIRLFVPESHRWEAERDKGATSFWVTRDLMGVVIGAIGATGAIMIWSPAFESYNRSTFVDANGASQAVWSFNARVVVTFAGLVIALLGFIFPLTRYLSRAESAGTLNREDRLRYIGRMLLGACLAAVVLLGTWGSLQWAPKWAIALSQRLPVKEGPFYAKEFTQIAAAFGAIVGTIVAALVSGWLGRRITYFALCLLSFISIVYLYSANDSYGPKFLASVFMAGGITTAFYGWFPLYLPELFPTSIRATSQGFAYNFGRVISAVGILQTAALTAYFSKGIPQGLIETQAFPRAGTMLAGIYLIGLLIIWLGPETKGQPLPS